MRYFTKEVRIGIVGIVALCLLVYGINYLKGINLFKPTSYFYVNYENINGLAKSSPVYADGFQIGIVRDIYYDYTKPRNVTVEIEVDTDMRIPKGSYAELVTEMLGTVKMNLILTAQTPDAYSIGDTIPGRLSNGIMESVTSLMPQIESLIPKLDTILTSIQTLTSNQDIPAILANVKNTTANLQTTTSHLNQFMQNDMPLLSQKMQAIGDNFIDISSNLKGIDYAATFSKIDSTIQNVKLITEKLNNKDNTIGLLLNDTELYNNLNSTTINAANLLQDLQSNPKRYVHFSIFGRKNN